MVTACMVLAWSTFYPEKDEDKKRMEGRKTIAY